MAALYPKKTGSLVHHVPGHDPATYSLDHHVVLSDHRLAPTADGMHTMVLAHELAHVVQQGSARGARPDLLESDLSLGSHEDPAEPEADAVAKLHNSAAAFACGEVAADGRPPGGRFGDPSFAAPAGSKCFRPPSLPCPDVDENVLTVYRISEQN